MASMPGSSSFKIQTNEQGRQLRGNRPKGLWSPLCRPRSRNDINCLVCAERRWRYGQCAYGWRRLSTTAGRHIIAERSRTMLTLVCQK